MTKNEIDGLLLKHVFREDIDKPPKWYYENFWLETLLCNSWPGLGLVVEEMERKDYWLTLDRIQEGSCAAFSSTKGVITDWFDAIEDTPFMAVAIAALGAMGVEIPEEEVPK